MSEKKEVDEVEETENIYNDEQRKEQMEEDEIEPNEAGFMSGYEHPEDTEREIIQNLRKKKKSKK